MFHHAHSLHLSSSADFPLSLSAISFFHYEISLNLLQFQPHFSSHHLPFPSCITRSPLISRNFSHIFPLIVCHFLLSSRAHPFISRHVPTSGFHHSSFNSFIISLLSILIICRLSALIVRHFLLSSSDLLSSLAICRLPAFIIRPLFCSLYSLALLLT